MQQLFQKYFHKVKFYPSTDNFTQALLVMLVTNITSAHPVWILTPDYCEVLRP